MSSWREAWLDPTTHGAKASHEVFDAPWTLSLFLEHANAQQKHAAGVSLDRRKFFDLLEYDIGDNLLLAYGAKLVTASRSMYSPMTCRYKVNGCLTNECVRRNGYAQGDSYSLQVALALMTLWTAFLRQPQPELCTGSFLDDCHFAAASDQPHEVVHAVAVAWQCSSLFDRIAGHAKKPR